MDEQLEIKPDKDKKEESLYTRLPKHMSAFSEEGPKESEKIISEKEDEYGTWRYLLSEFYHGRLFKFIVYLVIPIFIIYFWIFRYDDWLDGCHIKIKPSILEWNNLEIKRALKFIRQKSPKDYAQICRYVDVVSPDLPCGGSGGGCFFTDRGKEIQISTLGHRNNSAYTAAVIVHETCHSIKNEENTGMSESECYKKSYRFLKEVGVRDDQIPENWKVL